MITTRARCGSALLPRGDDPPEPPAGPRLRSFVTGPWPCRSRPASSIRTLHVLQEPGEILAGQALRCAFEAFHRPGPEIEVERAGRVLYRPPQRPAVFAHHPEQPGACDLVPQRRPVVSGDQFGQRVQGQLALTPDVAQLETGVVVARV